MPTAQALTSSPFGFATRSVCPGCRASDIMTLYRTGFDEGGIGTFVRTYYGIDPKILTAGEYRLDQCRACKLIFQGCIGDDRLLETLYTDWVEEPGDPEAEIDTYRADINNVRLSRDAHEVMAASSFLRVPLSQLTTLDYGMGWALWARIAATLGCQSYGSDLSKPRMAFAARHGVNAITDAEIADRRFHFINTEQVFEHVPEPLELLCRLKRSLLPGGVVKISIPSAAKVDHLITMLKDGRYQGDYPTIVPVQPLEHVNSFTQQSLAAMADVAKMRIVRPSFRHGYAFLRHYGTLSLSQPKRVAKELVRPWHQYNNSRNLFAWLVAAH
jgi:2-polyprenyl-3-methyl-5-hydroxy-6-metoxy-1,4-benzoquinol methylase